MAQQSIEEILAEARETYSVFGKAERALEIVERALAREPRNVEALNLRASVLYELDRDEEAVNCHQQALDVSPFSVEALHGLAAIANDSEKFEVALQWADRGFAAIPHDPNTEFNENNDYRQQLIAELYNEKAFALWYLRRRDEAVQLLTVEGPEACPDELETMEEQLEWLEEHPERPEG